MANARASMDGPVPATLSVEKWMEQHPGRAEAMLGPTRFKLWRSGKAQLRHLVNSAADEPLTLDQLRERIAGVDA